MEYINSSGVIGVVVNYVSYNVTGSIALTLFLGFIILMFMALAFKVPLELALSFSYLALLGVLIYTSEFKAVLTLSILFLAAVIVRKWFWR